MSLIFLLFLHFIALLALTRLTMVEAIAFEWTLQSECVSSVAVSAVYKM